MSDPSRSRWWPRAITGVGTLLGVALLGEQVLIAAGAAPAPDGYDVGVVTSLPFIVGLAYGGHWLGDSDLSGDRYLRIGWWTSGVAIGFTALIVGILVVMEREITWLLIASTVRWTGSIGGFVGLVVGVFEARAIERARRAERLRVRQRVVERERERLDEFTSIVSHDLRSPLNVAEGRLALAREECDSEQLDAVDSALDRMETIIEDTLTLAREGRSIGTTEPVDLATVAEQCWSGVSDAGATLVVDAPGTIRADRERLRQILDNLFRNAVEHGSTGSRTESGDGAERGDLHVTVRVGRLADGSGFYVADDGRGIDESRQASVFEPGWSTAEEGTGFGLAIVERLVEAHGWEVDVTTGEDGGARFEITGVEFLDPTDPDDR